MGEKIMYFALTTLVAIVGYFMHRTLTKIEGKQDEHTKSLRVNSSRVGRLEDGQLILGKSLSLMRAKLTEAELREKTEQEALVQNLEALKGEMHTLKQTQDAQNQNFGKVFLIVQKLYAKTNPPAS